MVRPSSDIDPGNLNVNPTPKRKRKIRSRPEPLQGVKDAQPAALARQKKRPASPGVMLEPAGEYGWQITSPHNDPDLWELQIADTFGTRSTSIYRTFMRDLKRLAGQSWDEDTQRWKADETELNAALAMVADVKPRTSMEAALAAQMVAVHWMQMRLSRDALNRGGMIMEKDAAIAGKLARTFTMQIQALQGMKGRKRSTSQKITVRKELHQHVHYHHDRGAGEAPAQTHAQAAARAGELPALPCQDESGRVVSLASRKR
ncbi:hypothetical protein [Sphingobium sp.]|uniref:hypothetical protein n=1 Tax=Sphingobium sp. TaxID=1912891 RepID=UPI002B582F23|nr:hypothetical protein [Sphingobium sp.]HUD92039.1 hypothetical protein [Sphingobium sp.]